MTEHNGWLECPECHTGYQAARCGISLTESRQATIVCSVCKIAFNVNVNITTAREARVRYLPLTKEVTRVSVEIMKRGA